MDDRFFRPCPCCGSNQVQLCIDANNAMKDRAKCRECGIAGLLSAWTHRVASPADHSHDAAKLVAPFAPDWTNYRQGRADGEADAREWASEDKRDAERWRKAIRYIGARCNENGCEVFYISPVLAIRPGVSLMRGSVSEHFTNAIDAAMTTSKEGEK